MGINDLYSYGVIDSAGEKIGAVGQVYIDNTSGLPTWVTAKTGLFGTKQIFIPLDYAQIAGSEILLPYERKFVLDAPRLDVDRQLTAKDEAELCEYYGIDATVA